MSIMVDISMLDTRLITKIYNTRSGFDEAPASKLPEYFPILQYFQGCVRALNELC